MNENIQTRIKKPTIYTLELETYLSNVQEKADRISDRFIIMFFILGLCFAPVYETWRFTLVTSIATVGLYGIARLVLTNKFTARMIISLVYAIFMLQFIGQMHGMAESHFFFFTNIALLIIYQDWRIMIPYTVLAIGHHSVLAILQANPDVFHLENFHLPNYFIGFGGRTMEGESVDNVTAFQLFFHFGLAAMMAFICGWWSIIFRNNSIHLMEKQLEEQAQNEELRSSEEELRQNAEELQTTNDQMFVIQKEIEEKQKLLNKAEKLVGLASYEIDLASQRLTHSDNLPLIYGEDKLDDMQKVIEIAHPEDVHKVIETLTKASEGKIQNYDISYRSKGKNFDEYKYYRAIGELVNDEDDNPEKLVGTIQDITERKKAEEYNQLLQALINNTSDAVQVATAEGKFIYMNTVGKSRLGLLDEDITNYTTADIESVFREEGTWQRHVEEVKAVETFILQSTNLDKNKGREFPVEVAIKYTAINDKEYMVAVSRDTTEQQKREQEIQEQNNRLQASEEELRQNYEELQTTQEELHLQKERLEQIFDGVPAMIYQFKMTPEGHISFPVVSKGSEVVYGLSPNVIMSDANSIVTSIHKDDFEYFQNSVAESAQTMNNWTTDIRTIVDGKTIWIRANSKPVKDKEGNIIWSGIVQEVTQYKELEQEIKTKNENLQASEEELKQNLEELQTTQEELEKQKLQAEFQTAYQKAILDNAGLMIIVTDTKGIITSFNPAAQKALGYSAKEVINIQSPALFHDINEIIKQAEELSEEFNEKIEIGFDVFIYKTLKGLPNTYQWTYIKKNTEKFIVNLTVSAIYQNGEIIGFLGIAEDITERKNTEITIKMQNAQLQASEKELKQNLEELQSTQSQLIQSEKMASLGQLVANIAHEINTPLGAIRSSAMSIEEILQETLPALPSFLKKLDDNTLTRFNDFVALSSQKSDILSSREKRTIKYELIEEFEKLGLIDTDEYADWIVDMNMYKEKELFNPLLQNPNAKELLQTAYQLSTIIRSNRTVKIATDRAAKIVFALKNFARQDHTGEKSIVNINESIEVTLTLYHNQIKHGIDITRDLGEIPEFMGYPDQLVQVWTNIIHNAIQAMKNKGRLFIQTSVEKKMALISIQDNGGGIPKEAQDKVFDAFFTTKSAGEGSGLGLDITKKIIEKHNGKIWFETLEGIGTTFFIQLPLN